MASLPAIKITAVDDASGTIEKITGKLGGFAAQALSVGVAMEAMRRAIALGDELKQASDSTGIAIDRLDRLAIVAKLNGASLDDMGKGFKFLGQSMVEAQTSSSQSAKLFAALGVSVKDAQGNLRGTDEVIGEVARALNTIDNETTRAAVGTALLGKGYTTLAATLRNYEKDQEAANEILQQFGPVSTTAANLADDLGDKLTLLGEGSKRALLGGLVPGMAAVSQALQELTNSGGQFQTAFGDVISSVAVWVAESLQSLQGAFQVVGTTIAAVAASIATRSLEPLKELPGDIRKIEAEVVAAQARIRMASKFPGLDNSDQVSRAAAAQDRLNQSQADSAAIAKILAPAQTKVVDTYKAMANAIKVAYDNALNWIKAGEELDEIERKHVETLQASIQAEQKGIDQIRSVTEGYEKQTAAIGLTTEQLLRKEQARLVELANNLRATEGAERVAQAYEEQAAAIGKLLSAQGAQATLQQQVDLWKGIEDAAHDAFLHIFEGGKSVFERLTNALKSTLLELLYQMTVKRWILNIGAELSGNAAISGAATSAIGGAGGNVLSQFGGSFLSSTFGGSGLALGTAMENLGTIGPTFAAMMESGAGILESASAAFAGTGASFAAVLGPLAAVAAGGYMLKQYLDGKKGGPMTREYATSGSSFVEMLATHKIPESDAVISTQYQSQVAAQMSDYSRLLKLFKGTGSADFALYTSQDPKGKASNQLDVRALVNGRPAYTANIEDQLGRDPGVLAARMALESKRAVLAALQASDLPAAIDHTLKALTAATATDEQIDSLLILATTLKSISDAADGGLIVEAQKAWEASQRSGAAALREMGDEVAKLADQLDGSSGSLSALSAATANYRQAVVQTLTAINQIKDQLAQAFSSTREQIEFAGLSKEDAYSLYRGKGSALLREIGEADDAETVRKLGEKFNSYFASAFNLLAPEEQLANKETFLAALGSVDDSIEAKLNAIAENISKDAGGVFGIAQKAFDSAAAQFGAGAETLATAAPVIANAANTMRSAATAALAAAAIPTRVVLVDARGNEIGGG